ncbi:DUF3703 domain-containing protein [Sphingomonas trueperi]|uniref:DUF3703 domain-containing protein n=1 Tax=Sphingomonas trueperi TaxID=53317 RepID=UPI003392B0DD
MMTHLAKSRRHELVGLELERHDASAAIGDTGAAWWALQRAHILSQSDLPLHLRVHWTMLGYAVRTGDLREVPGQTLRLALAPIGSLTRRIPIGNTGRSNVSAFEPMAIPADLRAAIDAETRP